MSDLLEREAGIALETGLDAHGSLAAAYVQLLRRFDNSMPAVAEHLRISVFYAYRCCARARWLVAHATHIPIPSAGGLLARALVEFSAAPLPDATRV